MSNNNKSCPIVGCFCWKNPLHLVVFFAILPFAVKGVKFAWDALSGSVDALVK